MAPNSTRLFCGLAAMLLTGCATMAPHYERPAGPVPQAFPQGAAYPAATAAAVDAIDLGWRGFFTDPKLQAVIAQALANNRDLRVAILNIQEARQQYRVQRADLFPSLSGTANATFEHTPLGFGGSVATAPAATGGAGTGVAGTTGTAGGTTGATGTGGGTTGASSVTSSVSTGDNFQLYSLGVGVSDYELDLWGRVRSLTRQAFEQYLATIEARRASQISIVAEVATDYLTLGADRQRLAVAQQTLNGDLQSLRLAQARFQDGVASELDVRQAQTPVEQARGSVATYTTQSAQDLNALDLVVGAQVSEDLLPKGQDDSLPTLADLPAGLTSAVLLRRPDVLQAEHTLKAYNADIGAARAAFFPTITLTGSGGVTSLGLSSLFSGGTWTVAPNLTLPIFNAGLNQANLRYIKAERNAAVAQYELAIQTAFREVADALAQRGTIDALLASQEALVQTSNGSLTLSRARYQRGVDPYLNTLTAQVTLFSAQQSLITARLTRSTNLVTLYRTLGGGLDGPTSR